MSRSTRLLTFLALFASSIPAIAATSYAPGFVWQREADWVSTNTPGSSLGNAAPDKIGNPVWRYEYVSGGGGLGSANPWYAQSGQLMVWDDSWWPTNLGVWARSYSGPGTDNNLNPPINKWGMAHDISKTYGSWDYVPIVKWVNPVDSVALLNINGKLDVTWEGRGGSPDLPVEVIIGLQHVDGTVSLIYSNTFENPDPSIEVRPYPKVDIPISITGVRVGIGEQLSFSARVLGGPLDTDDTKWVLFGDRVRLQLVSLVPEPETYAMLLSGLGLLALGARRRRQSATV